MAKYIDRGLKSGEPLNSSYEDAMRQAKVENDLREFKRLHMPMSEEKREELISKHFGKKISKI